MYDGPDLDSKSNCSSVKVLRDGCHLRCTRQCDLLIRACYLRFDHLPFLTVRSRCILRGRCTVRRPTPRASPRSWRWPAAKQVALYQSGAKMQSVEMLCISTAGHRRPSWLSEQRNSITISKMAGRLMAAGSASLAPPPASTTMILTRKKDDCQARREPAGAEQSDFVQRGLACPRRGAPRHALRGF